MQHLDDDMDELFQRAAEHYSVKTGEGDWESIAGKIKSSPGVSIGMPAVKKRGNKKLISLLLLLLTLFVGGLLIKTPTGKLPFKIAAINNSVQDNTAPEKQNVNLQQKNTSQQIRAESDDHSSSPLLKKVLSISATNQISRSFHSYEVADDSFEKNDQVIYLSSIQDKKNLRYHLTGFVEKIQSHAEQYHTKPVIAADRLNTTARNVLQNDKPIHTKTTLDKSAGMPGNTQWYAGVIAGPDFSKINNGHFNNGGLTVGIVAGLQLNSKVSIETGISWNQKHYTTTGDQFNMDKIKSAMPAGMVINTVDGNSSLIEIPLKIKYNLLQKNLSAFFITGGVAAYIITDEKNMYQVTMAGSSEKMFGNYNKNNYTLPAVAALSIGYERTVFKYTNLRIEPFLTLPLQGIGVGKLPITSAGLQFGLVRRIK